MNRSVSSYWLRIACRSSSVWIDACWISTGSSISRERERSDDLPDRYCRYLCGIWIYWTNSSWWWSAGRDAPRSVGFSRESAWWSLPNLIVRRRSNHLRCHRIAFQWDLILVPDRPSNEDRFASFASVAHSHRWRKAKKVLIFDNCIDRGEAVHPTIDYSIGHTFVSIDPVNVSSMYANRCSAQALKEQHTCFNCWSLIFS